MTDYTFIYGLIDPRTEPDFIQYVGKANDPEKRLRHHVWLAKRGGSEPKCHWIRELLDLELKPSMRILVKVPNKRWRLMEKRFISHYRSLGMAPLNIGDGGDGVVWTEEMKAEQSKRSKELWEDPEYRIKTVAGSRAFRDDPDYKERVSEIQKERWENPEFREKVCSGIREAYSDPALREQVAETVSLAWANDLERSKRHSEEHRARWQDEDFRERVTNSSKKTYQDPELRARLSELAKRRWQDPEYRRNCIEGMHKAEQPKVEITDEERQRRSERMKDKWADPQFRQQRIEQLKEAWVRRKEKVRSNAGKEPIP